MNLKQLDKAIDKNIVLFISPKHAVNSDELHDSLNKYCSDYCKFQIITSDILRKQSPKHKLTYDKFLTPPRTCRFMALIENEKEDAMLFAF